jgi:hypothetical protein
MMIKQLIIMWLIYSDDPHSDQIQNGPYVQNLITNCDHKVRPKSAKLRGQCNGVLPTVWKQEASNATRLNLTNLTKEKIFLLLKTLLLFTRFSWNKILHPCSGLEN